MTSQKRPEAKDEINSWRLGKLDRQRLCPGVSGSSSGCVSSGSLGRGRGCHQSSRCEQVLLGSQPSTTITPPRPLQFGTLQVFVTLCSGFSSIPFVRKAKVPQEPGLLFYPAGYTAPTQEKTPLLVTSQARTAAVQCTAPVCFSFCCFRIWNAN